MIFQTLLSCMSPSQVALFDVTTVQLSNGTVHKFLQFFFLLFMKMCLPSSFILRYVRDEMNVHAFMNELNQKDY